MDRLIVRPDKNEFLLFAMLDQLGQARGDRDAHFLRRKTYDHFKGYKGIGLTTKIYGHSCHLVGYMLMVNEAPDFSEKRLKLTAYGEEDLEKGRLALPHIKHFYENTDFEDFYEQILPRYQEECEFVRGILERARLIEVLDAAWETDWKFNAEIIPMPIESGGTGPGIGDTNYCVMGSRLTIACLELVAHECSHPIAKRTIMPIKDELEKREYLMETARTTPNFPKVYNRWGTYFEEHFMRAMQAGFINPALGIKRDIDNELNRIETKEGMIFIRDFYEEIKKHKESGEGTLQDVMLRILERLDQKYKKP